MGNGRVILPDDVQYMAAGTGVEPSEFNPSPTEPVHLVQIWILPDKKGAKPNYAEESFAGHPSCAPPGHRSLPVVPVGARHGGASHRLPSSAPPAQPVIPQKTAMSQCLFLNHPAGTDGDVRCPDGHRRCGVATAGPVDTDRGGG